MIVDAGAMLFFRARRLRVTLAVLAGVGVCAVVTTRMELVLPDLVLGGTTRYPVPVFLPLVPAVLLSIVGESPAPHLEELSRQRIGLLRVLHVVALLLATIVALAPYAAYPIFSVAVRNLIGYCGMSLVGSYLFGHERGWLAPVAFSLVGTLFARTGSEVATWAWYLQPGSSTLSWVVATLCLGVGLALTASPSRRWFEQTAHMSEP